MCRRFTRLTRSFWNWLHSNSSQLQALSSAVQIIGFVIVIIGIFLTYEQLRLTAEQAKLAADQIRLTTDQVKLTTDQLRAAVAQTQGVTIQETGKISRELFLKAWDDPNLRHFLDPSAPNTDPKKIDAFVGIIINHFATIFRQWRLGNIPQAYWDEVIRDARLFFSITKVKEKWAHVRSAYKEDFQKFVQEL